MQSLTLIIFSIYPIFIIKMKEKIPFTDISQMEFRIYSDAEIEKISVMKIVSEDALNKLGHCNKGGLYDLRMGKFYNYSYYLFEINIITILRILLTS